MNRVVLVHAGPTPWDIEDRLVGNHPLPLTDLARATIGGIAHKLADPVAAIYCFHKNEACDQAAKIIGQAAKIRPGNNSGLDEINLGLWQGLTRAELRFRHPKAFGQWEEDALAVNPPEGEPLVHAIERIGAALKRILRRRRAVTIVLALRPMAMQVAAGLLRKEDAPTIARHLHDTTAVETIELDEDQVPAAA